MDMINSESEIFAEIFGFSGFFRVQAASQPVQTAPENRKKEQKERKERKKMRVVVVVPPSGGRNFHTGAPIDAPFAATRSSRLPLRFYPNN
ncbi:hypothetical protein PIB30_104860 [Stylosanthes scabra]|uniref:Uncharacterized protein n=1 Tax=Stylosanthes scabra TaxID=79078 RepID=A0ABU6RY77_9FABA|nr:hypothetical protein [Stylosanthes scabra]